MASHVAFHQNIQDICVRYLRYFPHEAKRLTELQKHLANPMLDLRLRSTIPQGHMCASGILVLPGVKVLMLEHKALGIWVVPGGHYDITDGNLAAAAIRETQEETGLTNVRIHPWHIKNGIPIDIDTHPIPANDKKQEGAHQHFDFRYVLQVDTPEHIISRLNLDGNEVVSFKEVSIDSSEANSSIAPALQKLAKLSLLG